MIPTLQLGGLGRAGATIAPDGATTTLNPSDKAADLTLSNGNLTITRAATNDGNWRCARSTRSWNTGKIYLEVRYDQTGGNNDGVAMGLMVAGDSLTDYIGSGGQSANDCGWFFGDQPNTHHYQFAGAGGGTYPGYCGIGDFSYLAADIDAGKAWLMNSTGSGWSGGGDPAAGTSPTFTFTPGTSLFVAAALYHNTQAMTFNFGQNLWHGTKPSGFSAAG